MRTRPRRSSTRIGPVRINRSGLTRVTSITVPLPWGRTLVLWENKR
jgi:hypothetical protein